MSKKTDSIYSSLDRLDELVGVLKEVSGGADCGNSALQSEMTEGEAGGLQVQSGTLKKIDDISFEMGIKLKELRFWIDSLYSYNGKSTSYAKKNASKENGKKGGRPPKQITQAKRRILELENDVIPDLESKIRLAVSAEDEEAFKAQLVGAQTELAGCKKRVEEFRRTVTSVSAANE